MTFTGDLDLDNEMIGIEMNNKEIRIALAQITPVWLDRDKTAHKIIDCIKSAKSLDSALVVFGEALLPGYPFWVELTEGAVFNSPMQKELYSYYLKQGVCIEAGDLRGICSACRDNSVAAVVGMVERAKDRGGHSLYCSLVYINGSGEIESVHRKLMPTYDERLVWAIGDGNGLCVRKLGDFTVGALNCWENWMPMARTALYGMGEDLHIAIWPGSKRNTQDITRFIAMEARSYVVSVSGFFRKEDIPSDIPYSGLIKQKAPETLTDGGSCVAAPDGKWLLEPQTNVEDIFIVTLDHELVKRERHNFDPVGHYSRPDVLQLTLNKKRQKVLIIDNEE